MLLHPLRRCLYVYEWNGGGFLFYDPPAVGCVKFMEFRFLVGCICLFLLLFAGHLSLLQVAASIAVMIMAWYIYMDLKYPQSDISVVIKYGFPGCGKTLDLCKEAVQAIQKGRKVYTSIPINVEGVILFDPRDFGKGYRFYGDCLVLIDEGG